MNKQKEEMLQIHEDLFQYLIDINKKDSSVRFSMRKTNRYNRLDDGYWFVGNDKYLQVSFWEGTDVFQRISRVGFFVEKRKEGWVSNVYLTCKDDPDLDQFFSELSIRLGGFTKKSKHLWKKHYFGFDYKKNLKEFMVKDKKIIDEIITNDSDSPITMIDENIFRLQLDNILSYRN